jgi:adenine-specific DNA-methyltransferase
MKSNLRATKEKYYCLNREVEKVEKLNLEIDLIYIDPPFGTQREFRLHSEEGLGFDDCWQDQNSYIEWLSDIIIKLYSKLKKNGSIYIHNNFASNALVFGKLPKSITKNYQTTIYWQRSHPHNNIAAGWGNIVDTILVFGKSKKPYFKVQYTQLDKKYESNSFNNKDKHGQYALAPITGERSRAGYMYEYKGVCPKFGWRKKREDIEELDSKGQIHFGKNKPYKKIYLSESLGRPIQNIWYDIFPITRTEKDKRAYPTQKPTKLLKRIILSSCPAQGIVLDPFAGSGSCLKAVLEINKEEKKEISCICSDVNKNAIGIIQSLDVKFSKENIWPS